MLEWVWTWQFWLVVLILVGSGCVLHLRYGQPPYPQEQPPPSTWKPTPKAEAKTAPDSQPVSPPIPLWRIHRHPREPRTEVDPPSTKPARPRPPGKKLT